ncbi:MAG: QueT transporter family protein [Oscillospiraceae bacterium]|jgi:uncharacterized membrane protein|nr:QueT transporter family protein [Oscillospiraceae bacterium]
MLNVKHKTRALTMSALVIAMYAAVMFATQKFAFMQYQIRLATSLYCLSYLFPFLILPLGLSNFLSNALFGGLGLPDMLGGGIVGILTAGAVFLIRKFRMPKLLIIPAITLIPGLGAPIWLSPILGVPYGILALSVCIGQLVPAVLGYLIIIWLEPLGLNEKYIAGGKTNDRK